jgi:hypothetical protein
MWSLQDVIICLCVILQIIGQCEVKTHYDVTDKNNNVSSEGIDRHYHKYRTRWDISNNVCLYLQNWRYSICYPHSAIHWAISMSSLEGHSEQVRQKYYWKVINLFMSFWHIYQHIEEFTYIHNLYTFLNILKTIHIFIRYCPGHVNKYVGMG